MFLPDTNLGVVLDRHFEYNMIAKYCRYLFFL